MDQIRKVRHTLYLWLKNLMFSHNMIWAFSKLFLSLCSSAISKIPHMYIIVYTSTINTYKCVHAWPKNPLVKTFFSYIGKQIGKETRTPVICCWQWHWRSHIVLLCINHGNVYSKISQKTNQRISPSQGIKLLNLKRIHSVVHSLSQYSYTKAQFLAPETHTRYLNNTTLSSIILFVIV